MDNYRIAKHKNGSIICIKALSDTRRLDLGLSSTYT